MWPSTIHVHVQQNTAQPEQAMVSSSVGHFVFHWNTGLLTIPSSEYYIRVFLL